jgi:hypothetical protein
MTLSKKISAMTSRLILPGQLYLGVFSGPTEGILMIVAIFTVTGFYGMVMDFGVELYWAPS